jgi:hypothetical protein
MKQKVLGSVFVLAIALGMVSMAVRSPKEPSAVAHAPSLRTSASAAPQSPALAKSSPSTARALSCYKVYEHGIVDGMDYESSSYQARVSGSDVRFGSKKGSIHFGAPRVEQGAFSEQLQDAVFSRTGFGIGSLHRGAVVEEYVLENRRMEQIFRFPTALGDGALRVRIPVTKDFPGQVETRPAHSSTFTEMEFANGGIAFLDVTGATAIAYHSAVAIDAKDRRVALAPVHRGDEIVLEVPAEFMAKAEYPVVVDPWLELGGSASGGGISGTAAASDHPSIAIGGDGNPFIAWSDNIVGNYEIYVKYWNGFEFKDLGGASFGNGLSNNSGKSFNPQIVLSNPASTSSTPGGVPYVVWQDDTAGRVGVYFKRWNGSTLVWEELDNSASSGGLSTTFVGPAINPQVVVVTSWINNQTLPSFVAAPFLVWEEAGEIQSAFHYDGDDQTIPGKEGWYFNQLSGPRTTISVAGSPSVAIDALGRPCVAWHDTLSGNYEIYMRRLQDATTPAQPLFFTVSGVTQKVVNINVNTRVQTLIALAGINGSDAGGGVSQTPGQISQYPSIACDGVNIAVAWQETTPAGTTGTNNEIYVALNTGGGWGGLGGSTAGGGVSQTAGDSFSPSLDFVNGVLAVAWSDDTSGNFEIYARLFNTAVSTQWEQIGVQGSAFPMLGADTVAPAGGVSLTPNFSLTPQLRLDNFGSPTIIWADGAQGSLDIFMKQFSPNGPGVMSGLTFVTDLRQTLDDPNLVPATTDIPVAGVTPNTTVFFSAHVFTEPLSPAGTTLRLQVEVKEATADFTGTPTVESLTTPPGSLATVAFSGLPNRNYKWQARTIDQIGRKSPFVPFGSLGGTSFQINSAATGSGAPNSTPVVSTTRSKGSCGLLGLEALLALGLIRTLRRRAR